MKYSELHSYLSSLFNPEKERICLPELNQKIVSFDFSSLNNYYYLPGIPEHLFSEELDKDLTSNILDEETFRVFSLPDNDIIENKKFKYYIISNIEDENVNDAIILFHGLNEKTWDKYLPWASKLQQLTGKAVILFPITFHMNRSPVAWSNTRSMNKISNERKNRFHSLEGSSFANAAISTRLYYKPHRFLFSGFQTFYDINNLITGIKNGSHSFLNKNLKIDLFGYSIGAFLSEILILANKDNFFNNSKLFLFCGGSTTDNFSPATKTIMDSETFSVFRNFYSEDFESHVKENVILNNFYHKPPIEALAFKSLLNNNILKDFRDKRFNELKDNIYAIPLKKDKVIPSAGIYTIFKDSYVRVNEKDNDVEYSHEVPFPLTKNSFEATNTFFEDLFYDIASFFNK